MVLPAVSLVEKRFRPCAIGAIVVFAVPMLIQLALDLANVFSTLQSPPTITSNINGAVDKGISPWGTMPVLILINEVRPWPGNAHFGDACGAPVTGGKRWPLFFDKDASGADPQIVFAGPNIMIVNMSSLIPRFNAPNFIGFAPAIPHATIAPGIFESAMQLYVAPSSFTNDDFNDMIHHMAVPNPALILNRTDLKVNHPELKYLGEFELPTKGMNNLLITKRIMPKPGVFWGFPWEGDHTEQQFSVEVTPTNFVAGRNCNVLFMIQVATPLLQRVTPISVRTQLQRLFAGIGGYLALLSTAWYFVFVKKFKPTDEQRLESMLTLRGHQKNADQKLLES